MSLPTPLALAPRTRRGFTLLELMIVVAVVAILAAVALPSYQSHVRAAARTAAQSHLLALAAKQEQHLLDRKAYTATLGSGGLATSDPSETAGRYTFSATVGTTPPSFTLTATAIGPQASDGNLTLTNAGVKGPADKWK